MDPMETLIAIRDAIDEIRESDIDANEHVADLCDAFEELDNWLLQGGFLPKEWDR